MSAASYKISNRVEKLITPITILLLIINFSIYSQTENQILAKVGNQVILPDEFLYRYELTPQMFRVQRKISNELKQEFLYTLIAEKILASYGESILLDTAEIVLQTLKTFEEMFVRDELYKRMIEDKAKFKADSLLGFYLLNATTVKCSYIRMTNFDEAERIHGLLKRGAPFDFFLSDSSLSSRDTFAVTFGQFNEAIENEILTLPKNGFSQPIQLQDNWYILNVEVKYYPILEKSTGWESEHRRLTKLAKDRAEYDYYRDYMKIIFSNRNIKANGKLLRVIADEVFSILDRKKTSRGKQKKYFLETSDLAFISQKISSENLNTEFVKLDNGSVPLKDYIGFLRFENVSFDSINYQNVFDILNGKTRKFIEYKVLAKEGYRLGLDKTDQVKNKLNMWKQNYFYQLVLAEFADSSRVPDDEIKEYYNQLYNGKIKRKEVDIIEVLVENLEDAEKILNDLDLGNDIRELAIKYSIKPNSLNEAETGFKPISYLGEIASIVEKMNIGEIYGPVKVSGGYSIFKLVDVKEDSTFDLTSFDQIRKELGNELRHLKVRKSINEFIAKLAKQNNITINNELLKSIKTTTHNALVFQLLGFGGKITAVPLVSPNSEWVESWLKSLKVVP